MNYLLILYYVLCIIFLFVVIIHFKSKLYHNDNVSYDDIVTIIIPYRNRKEHLDMYLKMIQTYKTSTPYEVIIVEQEDGKPFNRGFIRNIGFTLRNPSTDYVIFNDVDIIPTEPMFQEYMKKTDCCRYLSAHKNCLGGVVGFRPTCFKNSNGFPNVIFEWGVEDRVLYYRIKHKGYIIKNENNTFSNSSVVNKFIINTNNDSDPRTMSKWLKSYSDTQQKAFLNRHIDNTFQHLLQSDGLNTLPKITVVEQHNIGNIKHVKVSI